MKWIGQHIYDLTSRFRNDVFLEDISSGTIASGAHLGLDSNNKIVKAADGGGDLTSIVAGTGLSGSDLTGPIPTLNVDASQTHITGVGTIDTGVWEGTDIGVAHGGTGASTLTDNAVLLGNGTGAVEASSHLNYYTPTSNQDYLRIGDGSTTVSGIISSNRAPLFIFVEGNTGTNAAGSDLTLIAGSGTGSGAGGDILFRSSAAGGSGTTVRATAEIASLDNVGNLQIDGGLTTGSTAAITNAGLLSVGNQSNITGLGTVSSGTWNGTAIASAYLDADTAHLAGAQTFTGTKTLNSFKGTAGATVTNILDEDAMGSDSATALATQQSIKAYADRPAKQLQFVTANWKDTSNYGVDEIFIPLAGQPEEKTSGAQEQAVLLMPTAGHVKEIICRTHMGSPVVTTIDFKIYTRDNTQRLNSMDQVGDTIEITAPTEAGSNSANTVTTGDLGTSYPYEEYDALTVSMEWGATGTASQDRVYITVVLENDLTAIGY